VACAVVAWGVFGHSLGEERQVLTVDGAAPVAAAR
jgi:hypothetical protein